MYLKSIEVNGFKSFANRMIFKFDKGITGIVGPNGSGKSNVADAVRWVLGEQSAKNLRGSKMEDVIFSGTELRKPQGSAYVAITLDNSDHKLPIDYEEVTVARRVYRSGESEYLINGVETRLKDVHRLFFDTGIGKEGYSIIGQGKIEQILSGKPDDRRELFDEAAGIVKYKKNKLITEKQLENEHQNLLRITDIISGLEDRVGPLKDQSEKAKRYLSLKEEQRKLDANLFLIDSKQYEKKIRDLKKNIKIAEDDKSRLNSELEDTKKEYDLIEERIDKLSRTIEDIKNLINSKKLENERYSGEIRVYTEKIASSAKNKDSVLSEIERVTDQLDKLSAELDEKSDIKKAASSEIKKAEDEIKRKESAVSDAEKAVNECENDIESAKSDIIDFINESGKVKEKVARYDAMLENIRLRKAELQKHVVENKSEHLKGTGDKERLTGSLDVINGQLDDYKRRLEAAETDLRKKTEKYDQIKSEISKHDQEIIRLRSRFESLRNLTERYEGYGISIQKVMDRKKDEKGIIGTVADIFTVEKDYETAIETALGGSIKNIVTTDEETAKRMISYLKQNKFGRATFLPVSSVKPSGLSNTDVLSDPDIIGIASDLVKVKKGYSEVAKYLLGRTVVAKDINAALKAAKKYHQSLRIVTLQGELISPGGSITGGAFKNQSNLLGRNRELTDIEKQIGDETNLLLKARQEETSLKMKRDSLKEEIARFTGEISRLTIEKNNTEMNLRSVDEKLDRISDSSKAIADENQELEKQIGDISSNKDELFGDEEANKSSIKDREDLIKRLEADLEEKKGLKKAADEDLSRAVINAGSVKEKTTYILNDIKRIEGEISRYNDEKKGYEERLSSENDESKELTDKISSLKESIDINENIIKERMLKLDSLTEEKEKETVEHKDFFERREAISNEMNAAEKQLLTLGADLEKTEEKQDELINYMFDEYEISLSEAEKLKDPELDQPGPVRKRLSQLKTEVRSLGDVNVNAIEEYKEVSEKYEFLSGQRDDIIRSEENLRNIISELDKTMRDTFNEKFAEIEKMFGKVFRELFGGGKASLSLVEDQDVLEAGIIINAQPPGKKLQNMMQLSGGEKSLTAISLLFAIQSLKPSPFCLLDEIEAALDDPNVKRFAKYLKNLTKDTQFIVITHRKGTMESADVLYGITMQEKGVSTQVSVSMIEKGLA